MALSNKNRRTLVLQILKFTAVGVLNTCITLVVIRLLNWVLPPTHLWENIAYAIGYAVGVVFSYFTNRTWTFKSEDKKTAREFLLFILVNVVSWAVSQGALILLQRYAGITDTWVAAWCPPFLLGIVDAAFVRDILAMPSAFVVNFIGSKWLVFRKASGQ